MIYQWDLANYIYLFNTLVEFSHRVKPLSIPPIMQDIMTGSTSSVKGFLVDFLTPILTKIGGEPTRESMIDLHQLVSGNAASVASNPGGGWHRHLALRMTSEEYMAQTGCAFVPPNDPGNYPPTVGTVQ